MTSIDINADLGENTPDRVVSADHTMLEIVTSASVACGFHAGNPQGIRGTLAVAVRRGVTIGAHPSYRDYENFGRRSVDVDSLTLRSHVEYQLGALSALAGAVDGTVKFVKPHGALYNAIVHDERQARDVVAAIRAVNPNLVLLGLAGGVVLDIAERAGLKVAAEAYADRSYLPDGRLVPRTEPGAVLHDPTIVAERMLRFVEHGVIRSIEGTDVRINAQSICVHGDSPGAVEMASETKRRLESAGVRIAPFV